MGLCEAHAPQRVADLHDVRASTGLRVVMGTTPVEVRPGVVAEASRVGTHAGPDRVENTSVATT